MRAYAAVLRTPHVGALFAATLLARFPIGINALAIILYLREERGSFAVAGVVAGALAAGSGIGAPVQGRLVDMLGPRRVLVPLGFVHAAALGAIVAGTEAGAPVAVLVACGFVAGFAIPPTSSVLRSMWPTLLRDRPELMQAAYALDSVMIELIFVLGPLVTALIAAALAPQAALVVSAVSVDRGHRGLHRVAADRAPSEPTRESGRAGSARLPRPASAPLAHLAADRHRRRDLRGRAARLQRRQRRRRHRRVLLADLVARQRGRRPLLRRAPESAAARPAAPGGRRVAPTRRCCRSPPRLRSR